MSYLDIYLKIATEVIGSLPINSNAKIVFKQIKPSNSITLIEDEVGNQIADFIDTEIVTLKCWLKRESAPIADVQAGVNLGSVYFVGRLRDPLIYDFPIKADGEIVVTVGGRTGFLTEVRTFESPASEQHGIKAELGQRIAVYVQFKQGN